MSLILAPVPGYTPGVAVANNHMSAMALDAADGVIDGRINGGERPVSSCGLLF